MPSVNSARHLQLCDPGDWVMTTLEELSASPEANHAFWTAEARQSLAFMRYAKSHGTPADVALEKRAFHKNMAHRRARTWLDT